MTKYLVAAHTAATMFVSAAREHLRADDRGVVTTETAIITALLAVAAIGLTTVIVATVSNYEGQIPGGG